LTPTDEAELIAAARSGSTDAFEQLYRAHSARVYGLCLRLSENQADAQDATQETFIKAWRALGSFRGASAFSTWLHRIAFNETIGMKRRRKTEHQHLRLVDHGEEASDSALPEIERIERAVAALPDRAREALVLNKIYGYTYKETAEFMSVAVGTCKAQVHRAVRLLREAMPTMENVPDTSFDMPAAGEGRDDERA
jgi:RNA polymerase sigma-70 factor, ECF subfamily